MNPIDSRPTAPAVRTPLRRSGVGAALLLCLGAAPLLALAAERDLDAHEHGAATLDIALDGTRLYLDLDSPADNVLGFEHAPSTDAQRASVAEAERVLGGEGVFVPDAAAGCTLEEALVDVALAESGGGDAAHEGDHEEGADHDAEHDDGADHEDAHADEVEASAEHDHERETHSDVTVSQVLLCENPGALRTIGTTLFERFDGFVDIDVQMVGPGGQDGARLTADGAAVSLEPIL